MITLSDCVNITNLSLFAVTKRLERPTITLIPYIEVAALMKIFYGVVLVTLCVPEDSVEFQYYLSHIFLPLDSHFCITSEQVVREGEIHVLS